MSSEEGPLSRWARRKAEARNPRGGAAPAIEEEARPAPPAEAYAHESAGAAEPAPPPDLPDIDSLTAESDFTAFLKEGVPQQLRRLALRKLWTSDPVLANLDGLVDYGEDYTDAAMVVEGMKSAWQVGRGYAKEEPVGEPAADGAEGGADEREVAAGKAKEPAADAEAGADEREVAAAEAKEPAADVDAAADDEDDETDAG